MKIKIKLKKSVRKLAGYRKFNIDVPKDVKMVTINLGSSHAISIDPATGTTHQTMFGAGGGGGALDEIPGDLKKNSQ